MRRPIDTLRPPSSAVAAPPQAAPTAMEPQPILSATPFPGASVLLAPPSISTQRRPPMSRPDLARPETVPFALEASSPLPPPTLPIRRAPPSDDYENSETRSSMPSSLDEPYSMRRGRRVGGWIVALVLLLAVGVLGWAVARPYLAKRNASTAVQLDPRAESYLAAGERALADGNLEASQEALDKASVLAESDPRVRLDEARVASAQADVPWLKLKILVASADTGASATDELRTTKAQVDERVARAGRLADAALASAPDAPAAFRAKLDALRLMGQQSAARAYVAKVIGQASQPETAYVLAALDLAEPEPLWTTVIERLRLAAGGEPNAGRARAALIYALAKIRRRAGRPGGAREARRPCATVPDRPESSRPRRQGLAQSGARRRDQYDRFPRRCRGGPASGSADGDRSAGRRRRRGTCRGRHAQRDANRLASVQERGVRARAPDLRGGHHAQSERLRGRRGARGRRARARRQGGRAGELQARDRHQPVVPPGAPRPRRHAVVERRSRLRDARLRGHRRSIPRGDVPRVREAACRGPRRRRRPRGPSRSPSPGSSSESS